MGFLDKVLGAVLVGVFVLAMLTFGYNAQIENSVNDTILDDEHFSGFNTTVYSDLSDVRSDADAQKDNFENQDPQSGEDEGVGLLTIRFSKNIAKFTSMMFTSFNLVTGVLEDVFGVPAVVFNVFGGLLVVVMLILGWRVIKVGGT